MPPQEEGTNYERDISVRDSIRMPLGAVVALVFSTAAFLYGQTNTLESRFEARFSLFEEKLEQKASILSSSDRYTGAQARERNLSVDQRFEAIEKANSYAHEAIRREIDHLHNDINQHEQECKLRHEK